MQLEILICPIPISVLSTRYGPTCSYAILGVPYCYNCSIMGPQYPVLIIKAPFLCWIPRVAKASAFLQDIHEDTVVEDSSLAGALSCHHLPSEPTVLSCSLRNNVGFSAEIHLCNYLCHFSVVAFCNISFPTIQFMRVEVILATFACNFRSSSR